ncbi:MAG: protein-methionine-sulfoxide reductase heme-binding subunit MsrQ [Candidatus Competibacteraceae bacterium]|nr:protein-methionine-sulfoxide reductase heme-binding subunit MsrQ [Candidatus Competibacteraceae bacterium]
MGPIGKQAGHATASPSSECIQPPRNPSTMTTRPTRFPPYGKPLVFCVSLLPLVWLCWLAWQDRLGANPVETLSHRTGDWSLRFLLLTLAVTPLRRLSGWNWLLKFRRMLGLFAFFYVCLHLGVYLIFDQFFDPSAILEDIAKRPYITVGFAGFLLLIPLAATSTNGMIKRLGRNWQRLHRLVYLIGMLGVVHYWWLVKADISEPLLYAGLLTMLLGYRAWWWNVHSPTAARSTR